MATISNVKANKIIKNHMLLSMGAGAIPIPIVDFVAVSAIQVDMIRALSQQYDVKFEEHQGKALITALTGTGIARLGAGMIKIIPVVGSVLGGVTFAAISGASTYALGEVFKKHFETGGDFLNFNVENFKNYYKEKFDQGKEMAKDMEKETNEAPSSENGEPAHIVDAEVEEMQTADPSDNKLKQLERLAKLKKNKVITEAEFKKMKKEILA